MAAADDLSRLWLASTILANPSADRNVSSQSRPA